VLEISHKTRTSRVFGPQLCNSSNPHDKVMVQKHALECSLEKQDCAQLYPKSPNGQPYTSQSCVRDKRLEGNVGRCGFPGAPCLIDSNGQDNCSGGKPSSE
jgi:hypothetical protein